MSGTPDIDALKALVAHNQYWSDWSTIAVFVALLLEIIIIFAYSKDKPRSETILSFICGLMLAVGVYGEYRFGSRAARGSAELQNISDQKVAELNRQAKTLEQANIQIRTDLQNATAASLAKATELEKEQQKTARAQKEAAEAQLQLSKKTNARWRNLNLGGGKGTSDELAGKPVSQFEILYPAEDEEAFTCAEMMRTMLVAHGWTLSDFRTLRETDALEGKDNIPNAPLAVRAGAWFGMSVNTKTGIPVPPWEHVNDSAGAALMMALCCGQGIGGQGITDPRLPENLVRIVIGKKPD
jgi:hypothetical protein